MLHPDYQYTPKLLVAMASLIAVGQYDVVLGSRVLSDGALVGGMPKYKYVANRALTFFQNLLLGKKLSEYHTGYRAFSRRVLATLPLLENSDDFVFDNQMLAQIAYLRVQHRRGVVSRRSTSRRRPRSISAAAWSMGSAWCGRRSSTGSPNGAGRTIGCSRRTVRACKCDRSRPH